MQIELTDHVAQRLNTLAQREGVSVDDLVRSLLDRHGADVPKPTTLGEIAQNAQAANIASQSPVDTATNSRDILQNEYADALKKRVDDDDHPDK